MKECCKEGNLISGDIEELMVDIQALTNSINVQPIMDSPTFQKEPSKKLHVIPSIPPKYLLKVGVLTF